MTNRAASCTEITSAAEYFCHFFHSVQPLLLAQLLGVCHTWHHKLVQFLLFHSLCFKQLSGHKLSRISGRVVDRSSLDNIFLVCFCWVCM